VDDDRPVQGEPAEKLDARLREVDRLAAEKRVGSGGEAGALPRRA
jgi:hypothetical protein